MSQPDNQGFVSLISVVELYWVLSSCYGLSDDQVKSALEALLRVKQIVADRADQVLRALRIFAAGKADFTDCLIERIAVSAGCVATMTFDVRAAKHAGMTLIR